MPLTRTKSIRRVPSKQIDENKLRCKTKKINFTQYGEAFTEDGSSPRKEGASRASKPGKQVGPAAAIERSGPSVASLSGTDSSRKDKVFDNVEITVEPASTSVRYDGGSEDGAEELPTITLSSPEKKARRKQSATGSAYPGSASAKSMPSDAFRQGLFQASSKSLPDVSKADAIWSRRTATDAEDSPKGLKSKLSSLSAKVVNGVRNMRRDSAKDMVSMFASDSARDSASATKQNARKASKLRASEVVCAKAMSVFASVSRISLLNGVIKRMQDGDTSTVSPFSPNQGKSKKEIRKDKKAGAMVPGVVEKLRSAVKATQRSWSKTKYALYTVFEFFFIFSVLLIFSQTSNSHAVVSSLKAELSPKAAIARGGSLLPEDNPFFDWLGHLRRRMWTDPVCGNGVCEPPFEFPAFETLGCQADCGREKEVRQVIVLITADFAKIPPSLVMSTVMSSASWNLCKVTPSRREVGLDDICIYEEDRRFESPVSTFQQEYTLLKDDWYVRLTGDHFGCVGGKILDITASGALEEMPTEPSWETCDLAQLSASPLQEEQPAMDDSADEKGAPPPSVTGRHLSQSKVWNQVAEASPAGKGEGDGLSCKYATLVKAAATASRSFRGTSARGSKISQIATTSRSGACVRATASAALLMRSTTATDGIFTAKQH
eukprot:CAMPEP_0118939260 /NCGR_PEP_ID=MMETSP1169-20130426/28409_1 /TAXON_ID=36882 /ORGANISM="Pyramimonas obovata, Strain CCMP722" /LENGTH=661 /DNA_ID=CAMNT_0006883479 /DNA_START=117 /DNA_END=2100 /DNA_ORIENTATION=+